jgi:hypothetical protein
MDAVGASEVTPDVMQIPVQLGEPHFQCIKCQVAAKICRGGEARQKLVAAAVCVFPFAAPLMVSF